MTILAGERQTTIQPFYEPSPGPPASLAEVAAAAFEDGRANRNPFWLESAREAAYDERIDAVKRTTGIDLPNPLRLKRQELVGPGEATPSLGALAVYYGLGAGSWTSGPEDAFQARLRQLEESHPQHRDAIQAHLIPDWRQRLRSFDADHFAKVARDSRGGNFLSDPAGAMVGMAGGFAAQLFDPAQLPALFLGPWSRVGVGAKEVIWSGIKQGAANAAVEAAQAPGIQGWRARAGLEHGFGEAAGDVAGAAIGGFALDAGGRSLFRGVRQLQGRTAPELDARGGVIGWRRPVEGVPDRPATGPEPTSAEKLDAAARAAPPESLERRAADGDEAALVEMAHATGATRDAAVRGAVQELEHFRRWGTPPEVERYEHLENLADAIHRAVDPGQPPPADALRVDVAASPRPLAPEAEAARVALHAQQGSPIEMAALMREHPEAIDGTPHRSDHKTRQALALAGLEQSAFERVAAGDIAPNHAAVIARHAADPATHRGLVEAVARADLKNEAEVRLLVADRLAARQAGDPAPHLARLGVTAGELAPERARVLAAGLKSIAKDGRIAATIEIEAGRLEAGLPAAERGNAKLRRDLASRLGGLIEALSRTDSHVAEMLDEAALAMASGVRHRLASAAFADRLAGLIERDGLDGLVKARAAETHTRAGLDDPHGPEADAQSEALSQRIKFSNPEEPNGRRGSGAARPSHTGEGRREADAPVGGSRDGGRDGVSGRQPGAGEGAGRGAGVRGERDPERTVRRIALGEGRTLTVIPSVGPDGFRQREYWVHKTGAAGPSAGASPTVAHNVISQLNNWLARIDLSEREPGRWEVGMVKVDPRYQRQGLATTLYDAIERDLGRSMEPSGQLTEKGHAFWSRRNPELVANHRWLPSQFMFLSPRRMLEDLARLEEFQGLRNLSPTERRETAASIAEYRQALSSVPKEALKPEALAKTWSIGWPADLRPLAAHDAAGIRAEVDRVIARLPAGVRAEVRERIVFGGLERNGFWDPHERLVAIALNDRAYTTARHEEMHVLRSLGLISEREWDVLADAARRGGHAERYDVEARWGTEIDAHAKGDKGLAAAARVEETVAEMWAHHQFGERFGGVIDQVLARLTAFFERLRNALQGRGFQSVHDVFRRIESGEVAARPERAANDNLVERIAASNPGDRPRSPKRIVKEPLPIERGTIEFLGLDGHRLHIDPSYIVAKRTSKDVAGGNPTSPLLDTPDGARQFVGDVMARSPFAFLHRDGSSLNVVAKLGDGNWGLVAIDRASDGHGQHFVKTAFVARPGTVRTRIAATLHNDGPNGLRMRGDPEALQTFIAFMSEHRTAAPDRAVDTAIGLARQLLRMTEQGLTEAAPPPARLHAEAEQAGNLGALAEACKR